MFDELKNDAPSVRVSDSLVKPVRGNFYKGTVTEIDAFTNTCTVLLKSPSISIPGCYYASGSIMAPLLGFKTRKVPALGASVELLYGSPCFVFEVTANEGTDFVKGHKRSLTGQSVRAESGTYGPGVIGGPTVDGDLLEGEFEMSNSLGVGLLFLNNLMSMKASERAKVETLLGNDMVRIVSEVFRHHSAFGDFEIYNDGRLNVEWHGTSYEHESYNKSDPNEPKEETLNKEIDVQQMEDEAMFRTRFSAYLGYLGDFLNFFITEPAQNAESIITGRAQLHISPQGAVSVRTTDEIIFEKVLRVVVPRRIREWDAFDGSTYQDKSNLPEEPIVDWDHGPGLKNIHHAAFQLREYARFTASRCTQRFRQLEGTDFETPVEADVPVHSKYAQEKDRDEANPGGQVFLTYSTLRCMADGTWLIMSGDGSTFHLGNRNCRWSSTGNIIMEAAGDIVQRAGRNVYTVAKEDIHHVSTEGGLKLKSRKDFEMLTERGRLWVKSDSNDENTEGEGSGIYIDAAEGKLLLNAKKKLGARSEEENIVLQTKNKSIVMKAPQGTVTMYTKLLYVRAAAQGILLNCKEMFVATAGTFNVNNIVRVTRRALDCAVKGIFRGKLYGYGNIYGPRVERKRHVNHIKVAGNPPQAPSASSLPSAANSAPAPTEGDQDFSELDEAEWEFKDDEFPDNPTDGTTGSAFKPQAQAFIDSNPDLFESYEDWSIDDTKLKEASRTKESYPYPGGNWLNELKHPESEIPGLRELSDTHELVQTPLTSEKIERKVLPK